MTAPGRPALHLVMLACALAGCQTSDREAEPRVEITLVPPAGDGSPDKLHKIAGRATGAKSGERIVLYARAGTWWVQPTADKPFTPIQADSAWQSTTHPGSAYAALLVKEAYRPPVTADVLPQKGGPILAVGTVEGTSLTRPAAKTIRFGGYTWQIRETASNRSGTLNQYDASNVWTDQKGLLHLRILKQDHSWTSAEVSLSRSLGYGTYSVRTREVANLEPAAVFSIFTWDEAGPPREVDLEISRWGEAEGRNAQYVIQPYYVPANVVRFMAPGGVLTHLLSWEPGQVRFSTLRGRNPAVRSAVVSQHVFTSGVPSPGNETLHINLYVYDNKSNPLRNGAEVIVESFEYLP